MCACNGTVCVTYYEGADIYLNNVVLTKEIYIYIFFWVVPFWFDFSVHRLSLPLTDG